MVTSYHNTLSAAAAALSGVLMQPAPVIALPGMLPLARIIIVVSVVWLLSCIGPVSAHHLVATTLVPLITGQLAWRVSSSNTPSGRILQKSTASPFLGRTPSPCNRQPMVSQQCVT
jgi:hypothetical protein